MRYAGKSRGRIALFLLHEPRSCQMAVSGANLYLNAMDVLAQLELRVEQLLARLEMQKAEISRLADEIAALKRENTKLASANHSLEESLQRNKAARQEALKRLDELLRRIPDSGDVD